MNYLKRPTGLILLIIFILLALNISLKKPLCIETSIVDRIDRVTDKFNESLHSCRYYKKTAFSLYFYENLDAFNRSLAKVESRLAQYGIVDQQITITVDESRPEALFLNQGGVTVGSKWLYTENFEQAVAKAYLRKVLPQSSPELISFLDDFIHRREQLNLPVRLLRESLSQLRWADRMKAERRILQTLARGQKNQSEDQTFVDSLQTVIQDSGSIELSEIFLAQLQRYGFMTDSQVLQTRFDLIIDLGSTEKSQNAMALLEYLKSLAVLTPERRIAVKTAAGLTVLPSMLKVNRQYENRVQAQLRLVLSDAASTDIIQSYSLNTHKLLIVRSKENQNIDYAPLLTRNLSAFLRQNKKLSFIQFDLTSFRLKSRELAGIKDYFKSFDFTGLAHSELAAPLGWQQTEWLKDIQAYKPVAVFDVVQYFRVN